MQYVAEAARQPALDSEASAADGSEIHPYQSELSDRCRTNSPLRERRRGVLAANT